VEKPAAEKPKRRTTRKAAPATPAKE